MNRRPGGGGNDGDGAGVGGQGLLAGRIKQALPPQLLLELLEGHVEIPHPVGKYAKGWRFERIPLVAGAVMRLCMYEILYMPEIPTLNPHIPRRRPPTGG